ncbi:hypothetical protein SprV_0100373300 [Sparganum proliferum]
MTDAVSALEKDATAADVGPSRLHLPLCTAEAYEDFVRRRTTEAELADKAKLRSVNKDVNRDMSTEEVRMTKTRPVTKKK